MTESIIRLVSRTRYLTCQTPAVFILRAVTGMVYYADHIHIDQGAFRIFYDGRLVTYETLIPVDEIAEISIS